MDQSDQYNKCRAFLQNHDISVVATSSADGQAHASVINYFVRDPMQIYFLARQSAKKYKNIAANPWTCMVVCDEGLTASLEVRGDAYKMEDSPEVTNLLMRFSKLMHKRNSGPLPILKYSGSELYLFRLKPQILAYANFRPSHDRDGEYFELKL